MKKMVQMTKAFLPLVIVGTSLAALTYAGVQQDLRQTANDPQIQMAEDTAAQLGNGTSVATLIADQHVDIAKSLAPFLIVTDDHYKILATQGIFGDSTLIPPTGSFEYAKSNGENRLTWEPYTGYRLAAVIIPYSGKQSGYVVAARSLREIEKRENQLTDTVALGWVVMMVLAAIFTFFSF